MRILVIEDDPRAAKLMRILLSEEGYEVDIAGTVEEGRTLPQQREYDAIVLDLGLPDGHGIRVVQHLRSAGRTMPMLVLTGNRDSSRVVQALDAGADDYVVKPVENEQLKARLRALLRRSATRRHERLVVGNLAMDRLDRQVTSGGEPLALSPREFGMLEHFLMCPEQIVTRSDLLARLWEPGVDPQSNVVDVTIARLRRRLVDAGAEPRLVAVRGAGYVLTLSAGAQPEGRGRDG